MYKAENYKTNKQEKNKYLTITGTIISNKTVLANSTPQISKPLCGVVVKFK